LLDEAQETSEATWISKDDGSAEAFLARYDNFIVDTDGVLWTADEPLQGAFETLQALRDQGKRVVFVTNNSIESRAEVAAKLCKFGYQVDSDDIVTSASAAAGYIHTFHPSVSKVYVIGGAGIARELEEAGISWCDGEDATPSEDLFATIQPDASVGAVLVGWDLTFNYHKLAMASLYLQRGSVLISTNGNAWEEVGNGRHIPGTGALVAAIEAASGEEAVVTGKPSQVLAGMLLEKYGMDKSRTCVLGDRVDTDVALGKAAGLDTGLVLSGVTHEKALAEICNNPNTCPTYMLRTLGDLV